MATILRKHLPALLAILAVAAALRLYDLPSLPPGLFPDEAVNGVNALQALRSGEFKVFYPENNGREGLFINIQAAFVAVFGPEAWALRLPSAIFGILTVLGIYFLSKELARNSKLSDDAKNILPLLAAAFVATSFWHINFSRIGFRAIMAPFWSIWAFYFLISAWRKAREGGAARRWIAGSALGGVLFGLGFHSYIAYRPLGALFAATLAYFSIEAWQSELKNKFAVFAALSIGGAVIAIAPLALHFAENPQDLFGRTSQISVLNSDTPLRDLALNTAKTAGMFNIMGDWNERHNVRGRPQLFWPVGILFLLGAWLSLRSMRGHGFLVPPVSLFLMLWLALAALPVVISNEGLPHALRAIIMIPPVFIFAALGGAWAYEWALKASLRFSQIGMERGRFAIGLFSALIVISLITEAATTYFALWGRDPATKSSFNKPYTDFAMELRALPRELRKYIIVDTYPDSGLMIMGVNVVQFLTDSATPEDQQKNNIYYLRPGEAGRAATDGAYVAHLK